MHFTKSLLVCASLVASTIAQRVAFTTLPSSVRAGRPVELAWDGADNDSVTITLKQGDPGNLGTVDVINGKATGGSFTWTPASNLENASNYALQITRNKDGPLTDDDNNFTGLFTLTGGSSSSSSSSPSSSSSARSVIAGTSSSHSATTRSAGISSATPAPSAANATTTSATGHATQSSAPVVGTGGSGASASHGVSTSRNATLSRPTLSKTSSKSSSSSSETASSSSETGEPTSSSTESAPSSSPTNAAVSLAGNFALLMAAVVGVVYLG